MVGRGWRERRRGRGDCYKSCGSEGAIDVEEADCVLDWSILEGGIDACCFGEGHNGWKLEAWMLFPFRRTPFRGFEHQSASEAIEAIEGQSAKIRMRGLLR